MRPTSARPDGRGRHGARHRERVLEARARQRRPSSAPRDPASASSRPACRRRGARSAVGDHLDAGQRVAAGRRAGGGDRVGDQRRRRSGPFARSATFSAAGCTCTPSAISITVIRSSASAAPTAPGARWCSGDIALKRWVASVAPASMPATACSKRRVGVAEADGHARLTQPLESARARPVFRAPASPGARRPRPAARRARRRASRSAPAIARAAVRARPRRREQRSLEVQPRHAARPAAPRASANAAASAR